MWLVILLYFVSNFCCPSVKGEGIMCEVITNENCTAEIKIQIPEELVGNKESFNLFRINGSTKVRVGVLNRVTTDYECKPNLGYKCQKLNNYTFSFTSPCAPKGEYNISNDEDQSTLCTIKDQITDCNKISGCQQIQLNHTTAMETRESSPKIGCTIRNQKDPYQIKCAFSTDPEDKRDFSVYFYSPDGRQELMVRCTHNERYECTVAHEALSITEDLIISVSETFSEQNGSFVCRNGGLPLDDFPCFYSGNSVKSQVSYGIEENGSNTLDKPEDCGTKDLAVTIGAVLGVVVLIQFLVIGILLFKQCTLKKRFKKYKSRKETESFIMPKQNLPPKVLPVSINDYDSENENRINEKRWSFLSNDDVKPDEPLNAVKLRDKLGPKC